MKKLFLVFGMITCMLGLTACGQTAASVDYGVTEEQVIQYADTIVSTVDQIVADGATAQYAEDEVISAALASYESAQPEMGDLTDIKDHEVTMGHDGITIIVTVAGSIRDAKVEILMDKDLMLTSITTNVEYSFGEIMKKAGLNTLMGMGTVFAVLILIIFVISSFSYIPKIQAMFSKKEETAKQAAPTTGPDKAIAQIIENEEENDDTELVAVIAAAIAAYEGSGSTDGYVVRSIRRRR